MKLKSIQKVLLAAVYTALLSPAFSDEAVLVNGNRIDGTFKEQSDLAIKFESLYLGMLTIQVIHLKELKLDKPMGVLLESGDTISVRAMEFIDGELSAYEDAEGQHATIDPVAVVGISDQNLEEISKGVWKSQVNLAARKESGNGDQDLVNLDFDVQYRRPGDRFRVNGDWDRDVSDNPETGVSTTIRDEWLISGTYDYFIDDKRFFSSILSLEADEIEELDLRATLGPLYGYQFYESLERNFLLESGVLWVSEEYKSIDKEIFWKPAWRLKYDQLFFDRRIQFYHEQFGTVTLSGEDRWIVRSSSGFRIPVSRNLQFGIEHDLKFDSAPLGEFDKTVSTFSLKIGYVW
jgi:hypothetical protein